MKCADAAKVTRSLRSNAEVGYDPPETQPGADFVAQPIDFTFELPLQNLYLSELCDEVW